MTTAGENLDLQNLEIRKWTPRSAMCLAIVVLAGLLAMVRVLRCDFTNWDDPLTLTENPAILEASVRSLADFWVSTQAELYIPVTYSVWWLLSALTGDRSGPEPVLHPVVFHAASVVVHLIASGALFALLQRLLRHDWAACVGAALFAAHPVQVESVAWASGLKDVLAGMFSIVALHQYVCHRQAGGRTLLGVSMSSIHYGACCVGLLLAMLSKPIAMTVPLVALVIDVLLMRTPTRLVVVGTLPLFLLACPVAVIARLAQNSPPSTWDIAWWQWPLIATDTIAFYMTKLAWPFRMTLDYTRNPGTAARLGELYWNWILPVGLFAAAIALRRRFPILLTAACLFVVPLLPLLGPIPFSFRRISTVADHYLYLPMVGVALLGGSLVSLRRSWIPIVGAFVLIGLLAARSSSQARLWQDGNTIFRHALSLNPNNVVAHINLSVLAAEQNDLDLALELITDAVRLDATTPNALTQQGSVLLMRNDPLAALPVLLAALKLDPKDARAYSNLGTAYGMLGRTDDAIKAYEAALRIDEGLTKTKAMLARAKVFRDASRRAAATRGIGG